MNSSSEIKLRPDSIVDLTCEARDGREPDIRQNEPVTCGVPWPRGLLLDTRQLMLVDGLGQPKLLQARALDRWPDGSVRWALLDWLANMPLDSCRVGIPIGRKPSSPESSLQTSFSRKQGRVLVDTGRALFEINKIKPFPFESVTVDGASPVQTANTIFSVTDADGNIFKPVLNELNLDEAGPVRSLVRVSGRLEAKGKESILNFSAALHFFVDSATVRIVITLTNPRRAHHPGGIWTLGQKGSIYISDASFALTFAEGNTPSEIHCSPEVGTPFVIEDGPLEIYQDSSGGENWSNLTHLNRHHEVPNTFRGYRLKSGRDEKFGLRATPIMACEFANAFAAITMSEFWQNFPKALESSSENLILRLFPKQYADLHEIQGGEQKTHDFYVAFARDEVSSEPLDWCRAPLLARTAPDWYSKTQAVPYLVSRTEDLHKKYLELVDLAIKGDESFENKREKIDEFGWRHFGDLYSDHENAFAPEPKPVVSHYNNQYDAIKGFAVHFMRSGDPRWFRAMDELARHVIDIDVYHTDKDKNTYNHGLFWHTDHYVAADTSTHRSYPSLPGVKGGGPSPGHLYSTGLMLHHFLTGNRASRETVLGFGQYVIDADDGTKTPFRFLDRGHTGHASSSGFDDYHGPGRTPGNALNVLVDCHRLSGDGRHLAKAHQLIRRCIHPRDNLAARGLHDTENRWYYTVFLHSLGKYLDHKIECEQIDSTYAYAHAALLHYSRWAAENERPYLDKPEILEFPTETWVAQDMRKCDMFFEAARFATGTERERFVERAQFFFDYAVTQLAEMPTRSYCRPIVLMMAHGYARAYFDRHPGVFAQHPSSEVTEFGEQTEFIPQKKRAIRRLTHLAGLLLIAAVAALIYR